MDHIVGQFHLQDVLFIIDHPGHLGIIEAEIFNKSRPQPNAGGHGIGPDADAMAFEILGVLDPGVRPNQQRPVIELPHQENRQADERRAVATGDNICRGSDLAYVEFMVADHTAVGAYLRLDFDEVRLDPFDFYLARKQALCVRIISNGKIQLQFS